MTKELGALLIMVGTILSMLYIAVAATHGLKTAQQFLAIVVTLLSTLGVFIFFLP